VVLTTLLLHANEPVSMGRLFDAVWDYAPPASARATLQTYVLRLRRVFRDHGMATCPVRTVPGGYILDASEETLDLMSFRQQVAQARRLASTGDPEAELRHLRGALDLWRGDALTNIQSDVLHREEVPRLTEEWLEAIERRIDVAVVLGQHGDLVSELRSLTAAHPQRERFWEQLVGVLYRLGRQAEALEEYRRIRKILADELGIDPSPRLQRLELQILRGEALLEEPVEAGSVVSTLPARPAPADCQLPLDADGLFGRADIAAQVADDLVGRIDRAAPAVAVIRGGPGVGKTALAVHLAHRLRPHFPDGQWYLRLADPQGRPREPAEVQRELIRATGGDPAAAGPDGGSGARVLLVLDDATSVAQVRSLLPGIASGGVLVTGRTSLVGLTALWGIRSYMVDTLSAAESVELLAHMLGDELVRAERAAAMELAELCGGLPLALRIAAAKFLDRWPYGLASYNGWLRHDTLSKLCLGTDRLFSVREAFEASYARLSPGGQRLFTHIASGGRDRDEVLLEELLDNSLIRLVAPGRYSMHPLLRRYALDRVRSDAMGTDAGPGVAPPHRVRLPSNPPGETPCVCGACVAPAACATRSRSG
jgi:DNA-binding SARP family transcriptional activator